MASCSNIILIGMPGVGKSTLGVLLAKALSWDFLDVDICLQAAAGRPLQRIIDHWGDDQFCRLEEKRLLALNCRYCVVATGGSAVYSEPAMRHLRELGDVVHLHLPVAELEKRLENIDTRGVVMGPNQSLADLYQERMPLYRRWQDVGIECSGRGHRGVLDAVLEALDIGEPGA